MINKLITVLKSEKKLFTSASIYTLSSVLNSAIPFLLMPIMTRLLSPEDYGYTAMFSVLSSIGAAFIGMSVHGSLARYYFEQETIRFSEYIGNCVTLLIISTFAISFIAFPFSGLISRLSSFPIEWLWSVILTSFFQFIILLRLTIWQLEKKPISFGVLQISITSSTLVVTILLIKNLNLNWQGRIWGMISIQCIATIYSLLSLWKDNMLKFKFNKDYVQKALNFGVPLIPHSLGGLIIVMTDRILLTNMAGLKETGLYSVGAQLGLIINILAESFNKAYSPWLFGKLKENDPREKVKIIRGTYIYFAAILVFSICFSLFAPWLLSFFLGPRFLEAIRFIVWLAIGGAFNGMYFMVTNYIFYAHKTKYLAWATFFSGICNIGISYTLIKHNGALGAAQGTAISFVITFFLTWILSVKSYEMPWFKFNEIFNFR